MACGLPAVTFIFFVLLVLLEPRVNYGSGRKHQIYYIQTILGVAGAIAHTVQSAILVRSRVNDTFQSGK